MDSLKTLGFEPWALAINILGFLVLYAAFAKYLYPAIKQFMADRAGGIAGQIAEAKRLHEEAKAEHADLQADLAAEREAARADIGRITQEAKAAIAEMHAEGRKARQEMVEQGRLELDRAKQAALIELKQTVADMAVEISAKVIRESMDEGRQQALVEEFLRDVDQAARRA